jgi:hypothetical protein
VTEAAEPLAEPLPEPAGPETRHPPVDDHAALARKNLLWGWALFGLFVLLFAGTVVVALVYLALD